MNDKYVLDESGNPTPETDLMKWGKWFETAARYVAKDTVNDVKVSTVFLGLDHSFGDGPPLLFETMIFGGEHDQYQERYTTRAEAIEGHNKALRLVAEAAVIHSACEFVDAYITVPQKGSAIGNLVEEVEVYKKVYHGVMNDEEK